MDNTNTVIGKDGYPMVVTNSGGHCGYDQCNDNLSDFFTLNAIADASRDNSEDTNRNGTATLNAVSNAENAINKGVYDASVAGIKQTTDAAVSTTKAITDYNLLNLDASNRNATTITKAVTDANLASGLGFGEIRNQASVNASAAAIAHKDIEISIYRDGCSTREKSAEQFAALQLQSCKEHADLAAKLAECCCELKEQNAETRALILSTDVKRIESDNANLRQELLLAQINKKGN